MLKSSSKSVITLLFLLCGFTVEADKFDSLEELVAKDLFRVRYSNEPGKVYMSELGQRARNLEKSSAAGLQTFPDITDAICSKLNANYHEENLSAKEEMWSFDLREINSDVSVDLIRSKNRASAFRTLMGFLQFSNAIDYPVDELVGGPGDYCFFRVTDNVREGVVTNVICFSRDNYAAYLQLGSVRSDYPNLLEVAHQVDEIILDAFNDAVTNENDQAEVFVERDDKTAFLVEQNLSREHLGVAEPFSVNENDENQSIGDAAGSDEKNEDFSKKMTVIVFLSLIIVFVLFVIGKRVPRKEREKHSKIGHP